MPTISDNNPPPEPEPLETEPIHNWFGLTYSNYLVLPRSLLQAMPVKWQADLVVLLNSMRDACEHLHLEDNYTVLLRGPNGRIKSDVYANYRHPIVGSDDLKHN